MRELIYKYKKTKKREEKHVQRVIDPSRCQSIYFRHPLR
jgi:hypothetical protein